MSHVIGTTLPKSMSATAKQDVCVYFTFLTFGPSQHKAETLAVFFLQEHCLLFDYIVTSRGERGGRQGERERVRKNT